MKKSDCVGCGACYNACPNNCIALKMDFSGFFYPKVDKKKCTKCGKCFEVCPLRKEISSQEKDTVAYVGYSKNEEQRKVSSSGGVFSLIAEYIIQNKKGIVFGAQFDEEFQVIHSCASNLAEIEKYRQSKYVQSNTGRTYEKAKELLEQGKWVLYSGTPCQIAGLKSFLGKEYDTLFCVDLVCHGVGAPGIWERYLRIFHSKDKITRINFKNKDNGWNNEQFVIEYYNKNEYRKYPEDDYYMYGFDHNIFLRESCYHCCFKGINRESDLTIGDAWGVEKYARKISDNKGCSLILVHSKKGVELFTIISSKMDYKNVNVDRAISFNQRIISSVEDTPMREKFYKDLKRYSFYGTMKKLGRNKHAKSNCLGMWKVL